MTTASGGLLVVTVATERNWYLGQWERTALVMGYETRIVGEDVPWEGYRTKSALIRATANAIAREDPDRLMALVDGFDLIFVRTAKATEKAIRLLLRLDGPPVDRDPADGRPIWPVMVGTEHLCRMNCHAPAAEQCLGLSTGQDRHLNTGMIAGRAEDVARATRALEGETDDQVGMGKYWEKHCARVVPDRRRSVVCNVTPRDAGSLKAVGADAETGRTALLWEPTGSFPCVVHTPWLSADLGARYLGALHAVYPELNGEQPPLSDRLRELFTHIGKTAAADPVTFWPVHVAFWTMIALIVAAVIIGVVVGVRSHQRRRQQQRRMSVG